MRRLTALLATVVIAAACGGPGAGAPAATTLTLVLPSPTASPAPSPLPTALRSAKGSIAVQAPAANARLTSPFTLSGDASVYEATLQWRLTDTAGRILASGYTTATDGAPARGSYSVTVTYKAVPADTLAFVEVFSRSAKDGEIDEIVRLPVRLT